MLTVSLDQSREEGDKKAEDNSVRLLVDRPSSLIGVKPDQKQTFWQRGEEQTQLEEDFSSPASGSVPTSGSSVEWNVGTRPPHLEASSGIRPEN